METDSCYGVAMVTVLAAAGVAVLVVVAVAVVVQNTGAALVWSAPDWKWYISVDGMPTLSLVTLMCAMMRTPWASTLPKQWDQGHEPMCDQAGTPSYRSSIRTVRTSQKETHQFG